ncbi:hypothetical protein [Maribacter polysaccharolyticus]|uniref:hypothetical protein n=1 Tax=Maribacter polysaccharolyticus TaxID=3020831 RepID=UPI00237F1B8E|nr:hypothetical protein [Maribacter polysaccharolyticus]MDE3743300.1 hypothetical protein [Maribacter polysaccharolyticus]
MDIVTVNNFWKRRGFESFFKTRPIAELKFPFVPKNGYDDKPPFIFIQNDLFMEIWDIRAYTDYQHTWETGLYHFTYTIKELLNGKELKIIESSNPKKEKIFKSATDFENEWINDHPEYKSLIKEFLK